MPLIHERGFRVRHYECDVYGHVSPSNYLRYMQEAAMDASAAAGYDLARYAEMKTHWLIRETDIVYLRPLTYGDSVVVKTWVADFRRVRSRRSYEFRHATTGEQIARADTDWVYLDAATLRPTTIPPEMITAFHPEGQPDKAPSRKPFPAADKPANGVFTLRQRAEWRDIDLAQHVNNAVYLAYIENCSAQAVAARGWPVARLMTDGFGIMVRRYRIEHKLPVLPDDEIDIATWVSEIKRVSTIRHYTITRADNDDLLARVWIEWVWIDLTNGQPVPIPDEFKADFAITP